MKKESKLIFLLVLLLITPAFSLLAFNYQKAGNILESETHFSDEMLAANSLSLSCPSTLSSGQTAQCTAQCSPSCSSGVTFVVSGALTKLNQTSTSVTVRAIGNAGSTGQVEVIDNETGMSYGKTIRITGLVGISLNPSSRTIYKGDEAAFEIVPEYSGGSSSYHISSVNISPSSVIQQVSVSTSRVVVVGVGSGTGTVRITVEDTTGGATYTATAQVTVKSVLESFTVSPSPLSVYKGQNGVINITPSPADATNYTIQATSASPSIATVTNTNSKVTVTGVAAGTTAVTIEGINNVTGQIVYGKTVNVTVNPVLEGMTASPTSLSIYKGQTGTVNIATTPSNAQNYTIQASTSNSNVATASYSGGKVTVTGVAAGTATITIRGINNVSGNTVSTRQVAVTVNPVLEGMTVSPTSLTVNPGASSTVTVTPSPADATNYTIQATSASTGIATATVTNGNVKITGVTGGSTTVTIKGINNVTGATVATKTVNVTVNQEIKGFNYSPSSVAVTVGNNSTVTITPSPTNATNYTIQATSASTGIATATVSNGNVIIRGVGNGSTTVTIKAVDNYSGSTVKTVSVPVTVTTTLISMSFSPTTYTLNVNATKTLTPIYNPTTASNKNVTWSTSNSSIATVDSSGKVTAKANGTATITATSQENSSIKATATINVVTPLTGITLSPTTATINVNSTQTLTPTFNPTTASNKAVTWSSSNTSVATVDSNGKVTGKANGTVTITCTSQENSNIKATASITVRTPLSGISLSPTTATINVNGTQTLTPSFNPTTASNKAVTWSSSNTSVATVDSNGKVTGKANGTAIITVTSQENTNIKAQATITVRTPLTSISFNPTSYNMFTNDTKTLTPIFNPTTASNKAVTWSSNNTNVATVDSSGKVTAKGNGTATITATSQENTNIKGSVTISVTTKVTGVSVTPASAVVYMGTTQTFTANVSPSTASNKAVTWSSSNTSVATVDSNGKVTPVKNGSVTITATSQDNTTIKGQASVTVKTRATGVSLNKSSTIINVGQSETLVATVTPDSTSDKSVTWTSSNTNVATVDSNGKVTAKQINGETTITATTNDGSNKKATCVVTVNTPVAGITLSKHNIELKPNQTDTLTYQINPSSASNQGVTWSTSNSSIATVSNGTITAKAPGTATITIKTADGNYQDTCTVKVITPVTKVTLNKESTVLAITQTETLTATVSPSDATYKGINWSSSNTSVATVDSNGKITAVGAGQAVITATSQENSSIKATCNVTVYIPVDGIHLSQNELTIRKGETATLTYSIYPEGATNQNVIWSSSDIEIATVSSSGEITAKQAGTVFIKAVTTEGNFADMCEVTVTQPVEGVILVKKEMYLDIDGTLKAQYEISPKNATNKNVTWTSSDNEVAVIESDGTIKPLKEGQFTLTVETEDGGFKDTAIVYIQKLVQTVETEDDEVYVKPGSEFKIEYTVEPADATDPTITWRSSDTSVATVDENGVVKSIGLGTATIYAIDSAGVEHAVMTVSVTKSGTSNPDTGLSAPIFFVISLLLLLIVITVALKSYKHMKKI